MVQKNEDVKLRGKKENDEDLSTMHATVTR